MSGTKSEIDLTKSYALSRARDAASKMSLMLSRISLAHKGKRSHGDLLMRSNELSQNGSPDLSDTKWLKGIIDAFKSNSKDGAHLEREEFKLACDTLYHSQVSDKQLDVYFDRIDICSHNRIDLNDFSTFILTRFEELNNDKVQNNGQCLNRYNEPSRNDDIKSRPVINTPHGEQIVRIDQNELTNKWLTVSREGTLCTWTHEWRPHKIFEKIGYSKEEGRRNSKHEFGVIAHESHKRPHPGQKLEISPSRWVHDFIVMNPIKRIAFCSDDRTITIIDAANMRKQLSINIKDDVAFCLDYWHEASANTSHIFYGTDSGYIGMIVINDQQLVTLTAVKNQVPLINVDSNGNLTMGLGTLKKFKAHRNWSTQVKYVPHLHAIFSCSQDDQASISQFTRREMTWAKLSTSVEKGVNSFAVSKSPAYLLAGGTDRLLRLFNPYRLGTATAALKGHKGPITQVIVNESKQQGVSVSVDFNVRIWDLFKQTCLQSIIETTQSVPKNFISSLYYHRSGMIVTASSNITVYPSLSPSDGQAGLRLNASEHRQPIVAALFNPLYNYVISACNEGIISIWDFKTGARIKAFPDLHPGSEITAMTLDTNFKRVVTGALNGSIYIWNFTTGQTIQHLKTDDTTEVSQIHCTDVAGVKHFLIGGWDRRITVFHDDKVAVINTPRYFITDPSLIREGERKSKLLHVEDITAVAVHSGSGLLATGCTNGNFVISSLNSGSVLYKWSPEFNGFEYPERAFTKILSLDLDSNLVLFVGSCDDGFIRFWDADHGHLLLQHRITRKIGSLEVGVSTMVWDADKSILYTGDTSGYITGYHVRVNKVLNIRSLGQSVDLSARHRRKSLAASSITLEEQKLYSIHLTPTISFHAHSRAVKSLDLGCLPESHQKFIICGCVTGKLLLFSTDGKFVGFFGQNKWWNLTDEATFMHPKMPADIQDPIHAKKEQKHHEKGVHGASYHGHENNDVTADPRLKLDQMENHKLPFHQEEHEIPEERRSWYLSSSYAKEYRDGLIKKREVQKPIITADYIVPFDGNEVTKRLNDLQVRAPKLGNKLSY